MNHSVRTSCRNRRKGSILILLAFLIPGILLFSGLVFDIGTVYFHKRTMQIAADAAAWGGAQELLRNSPGLVVQAARDDAKINGYDHTDPKLSLTVHHPPQNGPHTGDLNFVEVIISQAIPSLFMRVGGIDSSTVAARAVAGLEPDWEPTCVLALDPTESGALTVSGTAVLNAPNCSVMVNSNSPSAIVTNGGGCVNAQATGYVLDGSYLTNGGTCLNPEPEGYAIPAPDPYAYLQEPDPASYPVISAGKLVVNSSTVLLPGVYGGIQITGGDVVLSPGLYITDGFSVSGSGTLTGIGVTIYNTGGLTPPTSIDIAGEVLCTLKAPLDGYYKNILFFNSRNAPFTAPYAARIEGSSGSIFEGALYFPTVHLDYGGTENEVVPWGMVVARTITLHGDPELGVGFDATSGRTPSTFKVALVE